MFKAPTPPPAIAIPIAEIAVGIPKKLDTVTTAGAATNALGTVAVPAVDIVTTPQTTATPREPIGDGV